MIINNITTSNINIINVIVIISKINTIDKVNNMEMETKMLESVLNNNVDPFNDVGKTEMIGKMRITVFNVEAETVDGMRTTARSISRDQNGLNRIVKFGIRFNAINFNVFEIDIVDIAPEMSPSLRQNTCGNNLLG